MRIDLNSDLGESFGAWSMGDDEAMLEIVTSANVACGFHAGDPKSLLETLSSANARGVTVGAHVGYPDLVGFGRRKLDLSYDELRADVIYQIGALQALAAAAGTSVSYIKPHGGMYNTIASHEQQAAAVIDAIRTCAPDLPLVCLAGAPIVEQVRAAGLRPISEVFADRAYNADGSLCSRREEGAVLLDPDAAAARMLRFVAEGVISSRDGVDVAVRADSICVHGDTAGAVAMARAVRDRLVGAGVEIASFSATG